MLVGFLLLVIIAIGVPLLNKQGRTTASRLILILCPPLLLIGPSALVGSIKLAHFLSSTLRLDRHVIATYYPFP